MYPELCCAHQELKPGPRKQSLGRGEKNLFKSQKLFQVGWFFSPHFEMMLRNKPQQVKISPEKTQGFHLNECSIACCCF